MKKRLTFLLVAFMVCFTTLFCTACSFSTTEGGSVESMIEDPDSGDYDSGVDYMTSSEAYKGFNMVVGASGEVLVNDAISGTTMSFSALVSREIDKFAEDILKRLNMVWGTGLMNAYLDDYSLTINGVEHSAVIVGEDAILRNTANGYVWVKPDGTSTTVSASDISFDINNPATFALISQTGNVINTNFKFAGAITGGQIWKPAEGEVGAGFADNADVLYRWDCAPISGAYSIATDSVLKTSLKLAVANILAYGEVGRSSDINDCIEHIDHLGFLQTDSEENKDEVEKISDYILNTIIGTGALTKDAECLTALKTSITNDTINAGSVTLSDLAHNYRAYALLVPEIVKTATTNTFATVDGGITYNDNYAVYPALPKVTTERFAFPFALSPTPESSSSGSGDSEGGDLSENINYDEDIDIENTDADFIWMPEYRDIKSITFMPRTDVPVIAFMLAFEARGKNVEGEWQNIKVEVAVTFTMVSGGKVVLDNAVVSGLGAEGGKVVINPGVYDGETNDNSAIFNVSNVVKDAKTNNTLPVGAPEDIPTNGIVTVGEYNGQDPEGAVDLYGDTYTTYPNESGVGSIAGLNAGDNYIQLNFSIVSATIVQGTTEVPFTGTVLLRLAIGDPIN